MSSRLSLPQRIPGSAGQRPKRFPVIAAIAAAALLVGLALLGEIYRFLYVLIAWVPAHLVAFGVDAPDTSPNAWFGIGVDARYAILHNGTSVSAHIRTLVGGEVVLLASLPILVAVLVFWQQIKIPGGKVKVTRAHGSARFAGRAEVKGFAPKDEDTPLILGQLDNQTVALSLEQQCESILLVGPPGAGKTSGVIAPNLLRERGTRSFLVTDPKGELVEQTAGAVAEHHDVWVVNFIDPGETRAYNPLAYAKTHADAYKLAMTWITNTGRSGTDPFWDSAAATLMTAAIEHLNCVLADSGGATLPDLADFLCDVSAEEVIEALQESPDPDARKTARGFLASVGQNEKLMGSVFADMAPRFTIMRDPRIRASTSAHEVDFNAMVDPEHRPVAIYLVLDRALVQELTPLSSLFITQMFDALIRVADNQRSRQLPRPVFLFLDEVANIGKINGLPTWLTTVRSARIGALLAVQDTAQLETLYEKTGRQTVMTACLTKLCLSKVSSTDAEYFSNELGKATVATNSSGASFAQGQSSNSGNTGQSETGRSLMTADEIRRMNTDEMLVVTGNTTPLKVRQIRWYNEPSLRARANKPFEMGVDVNATLSNLAPFERARPAQAAPSQSAPAAQWQGLPSPAPADDIFGSPFATPREMEPEPVSRPHQFQQGTSRAGAAPWSAGEHDVEEEPLLARAAGETTPWPRYAGRPAPEHEEPFTLSTLLAQADGEAGQE